MPSLVIGKTEIAYRIRWSKAATRRSIVVTPGKVEVVAPAGGDEGGVVHFVETKRRWIFEKVAAVARAAAQVERDAPSRYATGAKVLFHGRRVKLTVRREPGLTEAAVTYRRGFEVHAPPDADDRAIAGALARWMQGRLHEEIRELVREHALRLGVEPRRVRIKRMRAMWASCGAGGILHFDPALAQVPRPVLEYAVVHELAHLKHRSHSPAFWRALTQALPEGQAAARWLEEHGRRLG